MDSSARVLKVIRARAEHAELIAPLFDAYRQFYRQPPDLGGARRFISERLQARESVVFVALIEQDGSPTALGFVQLHPAISSISMKPLWILNDLYVVPEARKRGIAKALMASARQLALSTQSKELILETAKDNYSAQKLYEQLGYERDEEFHRYALCITC